VTYQLAFANAFHDRNKFENNGIAFYTKIEIATIKNQSNNHGDANNHFNEAQHFYLLFKEGGSEILINGLELNFDSMPQSKIDRIKTEKTKENLYFLDQYNPEQIDPPTIPNNLDRQGRKSFLNNFYEAEYIKLWNKCQLESIILHLTEAKSEDYATIMIIGHSNKKDIDAGNRSFKSNAELSQARAIMLPIFLRNELANSDRIPFDKLPHIQYMATNASSSDSFFHPLLKIYSKETCNVNGQINERFCENNGIKLIKVKPPYENANYVKIVPDLYRSTEIIISYKIDSVTQNVREHHSDNRYRLDLFDFLYFTIYTITTTGYGDIIPISTEAKFVSSIANIYELFFMVIIFNSILSPVVEIKRANQPKIDEKLTNIETKVNKLGSNFNTMVKDVDKIKRIHEYPQLREP
jgi:hypothetical protein